MSGQGSLAAAAENQNKVPGVDIMRLSMNVKRNLMRE